MSLLSAPLGACRNAANWPMPGKALLGGAVACLVWLLGDTFYLDASRQQLHQQQVREVALQGRIAVSSAEATNVEADALQLQAMRSDLARRLAQLPTETEMPGLLEDITRLGAANGLALEQVTLLDEQPRSFYIESPMQVVVVGAYHDLATFIGAVGSLSRIVTVHDLAISPVDSSAEAQLRLSMVAKTYRYSGREDLGLPVAPSSRHTPPRFTYDATALRDPFQPPFRQVARPPGRLAAGPDLGRPRGFLEGFALEQFEMVGTLSRGDETFALLRGASAVYRLAVGDYLGPDHGRIIAIHGAGIEVMELFPDGEGAWLERWKTLALNVNS